MNAVLTPEKVHDASKAGVAIAARAPAGIALVLLGTGVVGGAFLKLLNTPAFDAS